MQTMTDTNSKDQVFLYICDGCSVVKYSMTDNGRNWCVMCQVCRACEFHSKIVLGVKYTVPENEIVFVLEEKANDSIGNRKEEQK